MECYWRQSSSLQRYQEVEAPITQREILSLGSSVFDPIGLFAALSVRMIGLLKNIWTKNGQHLDNKVEPGEEAEFLKWKENLPIVDKTSIDRRYFKTLENNIELPCVCWGIWGHDVCSGLSAFATKEIFIRLSIFNWKMQSRANETSFNTTLGIASSGDGSEIERTNCQRTRDEDTQLQFLVGLNYCTAMDTQLSPQTAIVCGQQCGWDTGYNWYLIVETCERN